MTDSIRGILNLNNECIVSYIVRKIIIKLSIYLSIYLTRKKDKLHY